MRFALTPTPGLSTYAAAVALGRELAANAVAIAGALGHDLHPWSSSPDKPWRFESACRFCGRLAAADGHAERTSGAALHDPCTGRLL